MGKGVEFIINAMDYATAPFKKVSDAIDHATTRFSRLQKEIDTMPFNIGQIKNKLNELEDERGTTTSRKRLHELNGQIKGLGDTIQKLENQPPPGFFTRLRSASGIIGKFGPLIAGAFSIGAITSFGESVVETTSKYQKFQAILTNQLGSASAGQQAMDMIQKFAAETPFQVDELTGSFVKLASRGFEPTKAQMTSLGDLAASMGKPFDQLSEAILDAGEGEMKRLKEFGINARVHGDKVEMTFKGQTTTINKSEEAMHNYILGLGKAPGVLGAMAAISATTGGKISNLSDAFDNLKKGIGEGLKPVIDLIIDKVKSFVEKLNKLGEWMKAHPQEIKFFATTIAIAAGAVALLTVGMWLFNAALWANPITWVVIGIVAFAAAIAYVITYLDGWGKAWDGLISYFKLTWSEFKEVFNLTWLVIRDHFLSGIEMMMKAWYKLKSLWDEDGANKGLAKIAQQQDERAKELAESKGKLAEYEAQKSKSWDAIFNSIHVNKDKPSVVEDAIKKATGHGKGSGGSDNKGKEMSTKVTGGGSRPTTINLTIHKLQDQIVVHTTNLQTGAKEAGRQIVEEILMALNSVNGKASAM